MAFILNKPGKQGKLALLHPEEKSGAAATKNDRVLCMGKNVRIVFVLLTLFLPALLVGLGERPVYRIQEVRIAETAREMVESGDWGVPRNNGELRLQKPPLPYWLTAISYRIAGSVPNRRAGRPLWPA